MCKKNEIKEKGKIKENSKCVVDKRENNNKQYGTAYSYTNNNDTMEIDEIVNSYIANTDPKKEIGNNNKGDDMDLDQDTHKEKK